jgi:hypothetical protein
MKPLIKRLLKRLSAILKKQPRFKRAAVALLERLPRLKRIVLRGLVLEPIIAPQPPLDAWGKRIQASLTFQTNKTRRSGGKR